MELNRFNQLLKSTIGDCKPFINESGSMYDNYHRRQLKKKEQEIKLKKYLKKYGWEMTSKLPRGSENLVKQAFDNDPKNFLELYNDLNIAQSQENENLTFLRYNPKENLFVLDKRNNLVHTNSELIWSVLRDNFKIDNYEVQKIIQEWLSKQFGFENNIPTEEIGHHSRKNLL